MKNSPLALLFWIAIAVSSCATNSKLHSDKVQDQNPMTLRVMAYNIHHANPPSKPNLIDMEAVVKTIREQDPDLVALQEIDANTSRSGKGNQAKIIAEKLGMQVFFGKAIDFGGGDYGVAILSKFPMSEETVHQLPTKNGTHGEPRVLATARIQLPNGTYLRFGSTHLDAQREATNRLLQIKKIAKIAAHEKLPFIIAGDFNATSESKVIHILDDNFTRTCTNCAPTIPVENPTKAIDFIAFKYLGGKINIVNHKVINETYASDHLPIISVLRISGEN